MSTKTSFAEVMAAKTNGRRRVTEQVCFSPTLAEDYQALVIEYAAAKSEEERAAASPPPEGGRTGRLVPVDPKPHEVLKRLAALVEDNPTAFYNVTLEQLERADWLKLRGEHPPRDSVTADRDLFNDETFPPAAIAASMIDPEPTEDVLAYFGSTLSNGEWERLAQTIWNLNEGVRSVPKVEQVSQILGGNETA